MKIGLSTANFFPEIDTEDMIDLYGRSGVPTIEVFLNTFSEMTEDFIAVLTSRLDKYDMTVNSVHAMSSMIEPCLFDRHDRRRKDYLDIYQNTLKCVRALGSDIYTFHGPLDLMAAPASYDHLAACYDELYQRAEDAGVKLAQENAARHAAQSPDFIREMKGRMKRRMLHTFDIKQAVRAGIDPYDYLEVIGDDLVNVHLNDNDSEHFCLRPGQGSFDFDHFFQTLKRNGYEGNGILELYRHNFEGEADLLAARHQLEQQVTALGW